MKEKSILTYAVAKKLRTFIFAIDTCGSRDYLTITANRKHQNVFHAWRICTSGPAHEIRRQKGAHLLFTLVGSSVLGAKLALVNSWLKEEGDRPVKSLSALHKMGVYFGTSSKPTTLKAINAKADSSLSIAENEL